MRRPWRDFRNACVFKDKRLAKTYSSHVQSIRPAITSGFNFGCYKFSILPDSLISPRKVSDTRTHNEGSHCIERGDEDRHANH